MLDKLESILTANEVTEEVADQLRSLVRYVEDRVIERSREVCGRSEPTLEKAVYSLSCYAQGVEMSNRALLKNLTEANALEVRHANPIIRWI